MSVNSVKIICVYNELPSNKLFNVFRDSSKRLEQLNLRRGGGHDSTRAREVKQITITVSLSDEFRCDASMTSSRADCCGSLCCLSPRRARLTAYWLDIKSQIPSHPLLVCVYLHWELLRTTWS